jgi:hypothetical protein
MDAKRRGADSSNYAQRRPSVSFVASHRISAEQLDSAGKFEPHTGAQKPKAREMEKREALRKPQ